MRAVLFLSALSLLGACGSAEEKADPRHDPDGTLSGTPAGTSPPYTPPVTVPGLAEAEAVLAGAVIGACDGDFYAIDLALFEQAVADAQAVEADPMASDADVDAAELALSDALALIELAAIDHRADLGELLAGVTAIAPPGGTPSHMGVVGCNALAVFQAEPWFHPTIAAGRSGEGRVLVFSKEISSSLPALSDRAVNADMTQLAENALTWLTARNPAGFGGAQPMPVLVGHGYADFDPDWALEYVPITDPATDALLFDPAVHPLAIVNPRIEDQAEADVLIDYVNAGGALIMGHQVWTWSVDIQQSEGQRLMAQNGLLWRGWYGTQEGPVPTVDALLLANTYGLLGWLEGVEGDWANRDALGFDPDDVADISWYAVNAYEWLPRTQAALVDPLQTRYDQVSVSYPADLVERPYTQVMVPLYHQVMGLAADQGPGHGVDDFPGPVDPTVPRVDLDVVYDFDREDPDWMEIPVEPRARLATGMYAVPGENLTLTVTPQGLDTSGGLGLRVHIGAHTDDLTTFTALDRPPVIAFSEDLEVGVNIVNNPYGGLIYLQADPSEFRVGTASVLLQGAVKAPTFFLGSDSNGDWAQILADGQAPWGDIVAPGMISTLPRHQLELITDPEENAQGWADIVANAHDMMGLSDANGWPHRIPQGTNHFVEDAQISAGWMHSGYPIMAFEAANLHLITEVLSWGPYHELGHNHQQSEWKMADSGEVSNNLFSLFQQEQFAQGSRLADQYTYAAADARLALGDTYAALDVWEKLTFYRRLSLAYGWDFYRDLFTLTRQLHADQGYAIENGQTEEDYLLIRGSEVAGEDLTSFFDAYGIVLTQGARDDVAAMGLAEPNPAIVSYTE